MFTARLRLVLALWLLSPLLAPVCAFAQEWPNKPIRLVINFAPGSSPDVLGRAVANPLSQALGVPVVVENRSGAGGIVGAEVVAKAPGDG
jgi:tripartite-type tricarboxylate transporter receptor subunit TctC